MDLTSQQNIFQFILNAKIYEDFNWPSLVHPAFAESSSHLLSDLC
jgi:hypothetical protein